MIHSSSAALAIFIIAQSGSSSVPPVDAKISADEQQVGTIDYSTRRPPGSDPHAKCKCEDAGKHGIDRSFIGIVVDAQLFLGADGKSVTDRQATIFRIVDGEKDETVKVLHPTKPAQCGLSFDYGKEYQINVRENSGTLETDYCIDPRRPVDKGADPSEING